MKKIKGFTLVESIMAMVIMGFAMVTLVSFLYPQIERSATPHYQTRAANLGQSLMSQILARGFDEKSDFDGGLIRCGEEGTSCTAANNLGRDGSEDPSQFNDVDDYIGCWYGENSNNCGEGGYPLADIFGNSIASKYKNFTAEITVDYAYDNTMKKIEITITAGRYGEFSFVGYRGNY
ncbi:prepilin-type N-terminal cleavage/methylation domain-containing protein [Vibrio ziniensis]|uniref:Prepilin-type N-terminal cleavage/methylation domain-containing protein n=1 Tax=Vibrio ziniensis TaxID=2711221 RepID=A0A6G7CL50_9VIBR|nr:prepilin-type N-terminal cleavage/methylation domain-containing protein [Vibrio ziniensis]QIH42829.1 prepilin-type N-terminal cleavage/methylation domain-containing protein [Vibrio ziniensis]